MRTTNWRTAAALALLLASPAACGEDRGRQAARRLARRNSCIASELALDAKERLAALDTAIVTARGTPLEQATIASHTFVAAYKAWADASSRSADFADSAVYARSRADSTSFARQADQARPRAVPAGTVEANAAASYNADFARAFGNPDHPCNQPGGDRVE
jgi:hypothetical protein